MQKGTLEGMDEETPVNLGFMTLHEVARNHVIAVLDAFQGNKLAAAKALGISRKKLYRMLTPIGPGGQAAVRKAIETGLLPPASTQKCRDCGKPAECYDHRDYRFPLLVEPVCNGCNLRRGPGHYPK